MHVLAHRAYLDGPDAALENQLPAMASCLERGWGVETDLRRAPDGRFYISHDVAPVTAQNEATPFCALWRRHPQVTIALNVKELGYELDALQFLEHAGVLEQIFLFDMELLEERPGSTARLFRGLHSSVRLAARASDRGEPVGRALEIGEADVIWLDEFDRFWIGAEDVARFKAAGRRVYAISPEIHGFSPDAARARWGDFLAWGVDGVCTDYPAALDALLRERVPVRGTS